MSNLAIEEITSLLRDECVRDITIVGCMDPTDVELEFYQFLKVLYLEFESRFVELSTSNESARIQLRSVHEPYPHELEEGERCAILKLGCLLLAQDEAQISVTRVVLWDRVDEAQSTSCVALRFELSTGQHLFFDCVGISEGIRFGGPQKEQLWSAWQAQPLLQSCVEIRGPDRAS